MKMSLWGVSHMDYLDRQETFYRKIGNMEWIPVLLGFITPAIYVLLPRILGSNTFSKREAFVGFMYLVIACITAFSAMLLVGPWLRKRMAIFIPNDGSYFKLEHVKTLFEMNDREAWIAFYKVSYQADLARFFAAAQFGSGLFGYVYFI